MFPQELVQRMHEVFKLCRQHGLKIATAESCTGGLLAALMTDIPGASEVLERGFVTYSNESKIEQLTVPTYFIDDYGAVSLQTAIAMAEGALLVARADIAVAITGIAGPEGGSDEKPVGTVFIAVAKRGVESVCKQFHFSGSRHSVRLKTLDAALEMMQESVVMVDAA
tara:strand:- start:87 stop:590 length:504 start_codon:yes stop_codon:yes gene_type:complete